jgi:hypothetical protein
MAAASRLEVISSVSVACSIAVEILGRSGEVRYYQSRNPIWSPNKNARAQVASARLCDIAVGPHI